MPKFLIDTCTLSDFFAGVANTSERLKSVSPADVRVSAITVMEILYGFQLNPAAEKRFSKAFNSLVQAAQVVPFDMETAEIAASIRAGLKARGTPIGGWDLLIAATAVASESILVTSNTREFKRIEALKLENWR